MDLFTNVTGFKLWQDAAPDDDDGYTGGTNKSTRPWIRIIKKKNELPTAEITCRIKYWNDGGNLKFYTGGGVQMGGINGFPLFDISNATQWGCYNHIRSPALGVNFVPKTVDINGERNIIVIDFRGENMEWTDCNGSWSDPSFVDLEYLILRLKSSVEDPPFDIDHPATVDTYNYIYTCDIINPRKTMDILNLSAKFFMTNGKPVNRSSETRRNFYPWWVGSPLPSVNYTDLNIDIWTWPPYQTDLSYTRIIGTGTTLNAEDGLTDKYNGSPYGTPTDVSGWRNNISLNNDPEVTNSWVGGGASDASYNLNNLLWCSVSAPRHIDISSVESKAKYENSSDIRWIQNFTDVSGSREKAISMGGGYARYPRVIDLPRCTTTPYYTFNNGDNIQLWDYDTYLTDESQYAPGNTNGGDSKVTNYFDVKYKLLLPPHAPSTPTATATLRYEFGKNLGSVVTFERYKDMSGIPAPLGNTEQASEYADRNLEDITLEWNNEDSVFDYRWDSSEGADGKNGDIKSIRFFDIASGHSTHTAYLDGLFIGDDTNNVLSTCIDHEEYDLSFNIFQFRLYNKDASGVLTLGSEPYVKTFSTTKVSGSDYDISWVPHNYVPYRYYDGIVGTDPVLKRKVPLQVIQEYVNFNPSKMVTRKVFEYKENVFPYPASDGGIISDIVYLGESLWMFGLTRRHRHVINIAHMKLIWIYLLTLLMLNQIQTPWLRV